MIEQEETIETVKAENERLKKQVEAAKNGLECLTAYLEQLPGSQTFLDLLRLWFSDFSGESPDAIVTEVRKRRQQG